MTKSIWVPKSETKASVVDGKVTVWDEMVFEQKTIQKPGFAKPAETEKKP